MKPISIPNSNLKIVQLLQMDRKDCTNALLWSKSALTTDGVGGEGVNPPPSKINTFLGP